MTVQTNTNVASFNGNGVAQIFPIAFKFNNDTDLVVLLVDDATGAASLLTLNSDYTVSGEGDEEGGSITILVAPATGQRLTVIRRVDILQLTDLRNQGKFFAEVHEAAFDLLTMIAQQHQSEIGLSLRVAETDPQPERIPPVAQRANMLMAFDSNGNPTTALPIADSSTELRQELAAAGGAESVGHNSETVAAALDRAGESNAHAFGNVKRNEYDYATLQASITPPITEWTRTNFDAAGVHAAGTVGILSAACSGQAFSHYLLKVVITTTTPGRVKILQGGADIIGDQPNGIVFSNAAILNDATENNRYVDNDTYYFVVITSGSGFADFSFETDTSWAGTISDATLQPVNATKFAFAGASADAPGLNGPVGLKVGAYNRGDMALGDKFTLGVMQYDGTLPTPAYNVAIGAGALATNFKGDENTAVGTWALRYSEGSNNVAMGYSAAKMTTKGQELVAIGYKAMFDNTTGFRNTAVGFWASGLNNTGKEITALGYYAGRNATGGNNNTYIGARSGQANIKGSSNTYVGALAGYGTGAAATTFDFQLLAGSESQGYGHQAVALGFQARVGTSSVASEGGVAVGKSATVSGAGIGSIAIGRSASAGSSTPATAVGDASVATGERSVAVGQSAQATTEQSVSVGGLSEAKGQYNTSIGAQAGRNNTGAGNTFVGRLAGNAETNAFANCSLLGANTAVTADNQVQLGDSLTTTYVYGTVQNRSDARDKADIADTALGIDFIMGLRPVHGRWDMREDYRVVNDDGTVTVFEKDGSKKRNRLHQWFVAQEVAELCTSLNVEFGGLQHHSVSGGEDVFSLGYDEFIPPVVKAVQECWSRLDAMEARLSALESM
jgi:hypothetical protein